MGDNPHTETRRECFDGKDNDHDGKSDCADPDCMKDKRIRQRCQMYGGGGKDTGAGDGVCNVLGPAIRSCRGLKDAKEGDKSICKTACIQESFDCIDNKAMAMYRAKIVDIKDMCGGTTIACDSILSNMGKVFQPICCPSNARACARAPPSPATPSVHSSLCRSSTSAHWRLRRPTSTAKARWHTSPMCALRATSIKHWACTGTGTVHRHLPDGPDTGTCQGGTCQTGRCTSPRACVQ